MNYFSKRQWWIVVFVLLTTVNITILVMNIAERPAPPPKGDRSMERGLNRFVRQELNLSDEQFQMFRQMSKENRKKSREVFGQLAGLRSKMLEELARDNPDTTKLSEIAIGSGRLHEMLKRLSIKHFMEMRKCCNKVQNQRLNELMHEMKQGRGFCPKRRGVRVNCKQKRRKVD